MRKTVSKISLLFILFILLSFQSSTTQSQALPLQTSQVVKTQPISKNFKANLDYGKMPLYFILNQGQVNDRVLFYAKASRYTLWLTKKGLIFDSLRKIEEENCKCQNLEKGSNPEGSKYDRNISKLIFLNSNKKPEVIPVNGTAHEVNYFTGNDKSKWRTRILTSKTVLYKGLYKNIDLKVYGMEKQIEYDFIVKPGGEVSNINFEYKGVKETKIDERGNLVIETRFGELIQTKPLSYQVIEEKRVNVEINFKEIEKNCYGFKAEEYHKDYELIIDPLILDYSTYMGGSSGNSGYSIAVDSDGAAYVTGKTTSTDFPTDNPIYKNYSGSTDAFVTKINSAGDALIYSTYLGGSSSDIGYDIAVDSEGVAYVTGETSSTDFPIKNALYGSNAGGKDAFITKIGSKGNALVYSTFLGGSNYDHGRSIAVDSKDAIYVTGYTQSTDFPIKNAIHNSNWGLTDAFVTKINPAGNALIYSTYLGGFSHDGGYGIDVDKKGAAYVTGETSSFEFPTKKPIQQKLAGFSKDAFVSKIHPNGGILVYSTYLGGTKGEIGYGIAVDRKCMAYITGYTESTDFPTKKAIYDKHAGGLRDSFITMIKRNGKVLIYSTYLGGSSGDTGRDITVDRKLNVYVTGYTSSVDFPTKEAFMGNKTEYDDDVFITKIKKKGKYIIFSTYLGGSSYDTGFGIAVDSKYAVYVTGDTWSEDFPTENPIWNSKKGWTDVFISKFNLEKEKSPL